jgi:hypothetical protein
MLARRANERVGKEKCFQVIGKDAKPESLKGQIAQKVWSQSD